MGFEFASGVKNFLKDWQRPPARFRPAPFFILNDEHEGAAARKRIRVMMRQMRAVGYGGVFLHPRPGLTTEYLSEEWFDTIEFCRQEAARNGLDVHLYDENTYPSGFAGGHVVARCPEARATHVRWHILRGWPDLCRGDEILAGYALESFDPVRPGRRLDQTELDLWLQDQHPSVKRKPLPKKSILVFAMNQMSSFAWFGDFPYASLVHPETARIFLETTYEEYRRRMRQQFGKTMFSIFTDEPNLGTTHSGPTGPALPFSLRFCAEFRRRHGYELTDHLAELFFDWDDFRRVRFDYYETLHQLWMANWALPLERWCRKNKLALTGHYLEHDWPSPYATPGHVHLLAHMDWPGTDMLLCNPLDGESPPWFTTQDRAPKGQEPHFTMYLRQCASVANQLGKKRVLCECWGAGGHDSTFEDYKRIGDWLVVHGVNLLNPHMAMVTIRGSRKFDHPQFFSDQSSWFPYLKPLNDHFSRLCGLMSRGRVENEILLLDPLTTGYLIARRSDPNPAIFKPLDDAFSNLVQVLSDHQFDFDLGDEYVLEEFGRVDRGRLIVGRQSYGTIVWPARMINVRSPTVRLIEQFLSSGGIILSLEAGNVLVDGRRNNRMTTFRRRHSEKWRQLPDVGALLRFLKQQYPPSLELSGQESNSGIGHLRRILQDGSRLHLLVNSTDRPARLVARAWGRSVRWLDTHTGKEHQLAVRSLPGKRIEFEVGLAAIDCKVFQVNDSVDTGVPVVSSVSTREENIRLEVANVKRAEPNRLALDICDLTLNGRKKVENIRVQFATQRIWRAQGFHGNLWFRAIQYRRQIVDRKIEGGGVGFTLKFPFEIGRGVRLDSLMLAMECPELYEVRVNHRPVSFIRASSWLDPHLRITSISRAVEHGANEVSIMGRPFNVRMELDQIYVLGDFGLEPARHGFRMVPPSSLQLGAWRKQGLPFYDAGVDYTVLIPARRATRAILHVQEWEGSVVEVQHKDRPLGQIAWPPYEMDITRLMNEHRRIEIVLRVMGTPRNLFGPFHDPNRFRRISGQWLTGSPWGPIAGKKYDLLDYGLMKPPQVVIR